MIDALKLLPTAFPGAWIVLAAAALALGFLAGTLHFRSLETVTRQLLAGDLRAVFLQLGRLAGLGVLLWLFAMVGASTLIAGAAGVLAARSRVLARMRSAP